MTSKLVTKQAVKQMLQARFERKQFTSAISANITLTTAGALVYLNPIDQGSDINNRDGDTIQAKHLRLHLTCFNTTATQGSSIRVIIFSDTMSVAGGIVVGDVLETANYTSPVSALSMQRNRFHIYYDKTESQVTTASNQEINMIANFPINRKIYFSGVTGSTAFAGKNSLFMLVIGSNGLPKYHYQFGLIYQDN